MKANINNFFNAKEVFQHPNKENFLRRRRRRFSMLVFLGVFGPLHHFFPPFLVFVVSFVSNCCYMNKHTV